MRLRSPSHSVVDWISNVREFTHRFAQMVVLPREQVPVLVSCLPCRRARASVDLPNPILR